MLWDQLEKRGRTQHVGDLSEVMVTFVGAMTCWEDEEMNAEAIGGQY